MSTEREFEEAIAIDTVLDMLKVSTIRVVTITVAENSEWVDYIYTYDPEETKDTEALKNLLCEVDPGEEYTISFKNVR